MRRKLLDTDTLSYYLKGIEPVVEHAGRYLERFGRLEFSTVTYYKIRRGLLHAKATAKLRQFERFALASVIWPFDLAAARVAAGLCAAM